MSTIRLHQVAYGHAFKERLLLGVMRVVMGRPPPDVVRTLLYRRAYWGDRLNELLQSVMRGPGPWSIGHRELFATFVAHLNQCRF